MNSDDSAIDAKHSLHEFEVGDEIAVSGRETPMEVVEKEETPSGRGVEVVAENRYGEYRLRQYEDDTILLLVGGDRQLEGTVEVTHADVE